MEVRSYMVPQRETHNQHDLTSAQLAAVRRAVELRGMQRVAAVVGIAPGTLLRALSRFDVHRGTLSLLRHAVDAGVIHQLTTEAKASPQKGSK